MLPWFFYTAQNIIFVISSSATPRPNQSNPNNTRCLYKESEAMADQSDIGPRPFSISYLFYVNFFSGLGDPRPPPPTPQMDFLATTIVMDGGRHLI